MAGKLYRTEDRMLATSLLLSGESLLGLDFSNDITPIKYEQTLSGVYFVFNNTAKLSLLVELYNEDRLTFPPRKIAGVLEKITKDAIKEIDNFNNMRCFMKNEKENKNED